MEYIKSVYSIDHILHNHIKYNYRLLNMIYMDAQDGQDMKYKKSCISCTSMSTIC